MGKAPRNDDVTALFAAARTGKIAAVRACLLAGVKVDARMPSKLQKPLGPGRETALMIAAEKGHRPVVALLLKARADPNTIDEFRGTALRRAVIGNHTTTVAALLKAGADPNLRGHDKETVLRAAASPSVDPKITKLLIAHGADVDAAATHLEALGQRRVANLAENAALAERGAVVELAVELLPSLRQLTMDRLRELFCHFQVDRQRNSAGFL